jgi:hypothetical protein
VAVTRASQRSLPGLERLHLNNLNFNLVTEQPIDILEIAPMLHTVTFGLRITPVKCLLPLQQLKNCLISKCLVEHCVYLLRKCTNLTHCTLQRSHDAGMVHPSLVHSRLQSLRLVTWDFRASGPLLLDIISLPSLLDLDVSL